MFVIHTHAYTHRVVGKVLQPVLLRVLVMHSKISDYEKAHSVASHE